MAPKFINLPTVSILLLTFLLSTTLIGGCPAAQTPTAPPQQEEDQATQQPPTTPDDGLDRPIPQPDLDDTTTSGPGGGPAGDEGQGGAGGEGSGGAGTEFVVLSVDEPGDPLAVRPGTVVNVEFNLVDSAGSVESGELLLARDADADGQPDDIPILRRSISVTSGSNTVPFNTSEAAGLLTNGFGRFLFGIQVTTVSSDVKTAYSPATVTIDAIEPTAAWVGAGSPPEIAVDQEDHLVNRDKDWEIQLTTSDNSPHTVRIWLEETKDGTQFELVPETTFAAGTDTRTFTTPLSAYPAGTYYYYVTVSDGIAPALTFYGENQSTMAQVRLAVTNRLIGTFELEQLADEPSNPANSKGAILEGFNFNDLAGTSMASVPDLTGDGNSELIIGARFGKPNLQQFDGTGWGEAYLIYGESSRLGGVKELNSVGSISDPNEGGIPGVTFRGIRVPQNTDYTDGLADIAVIDDMDGDDLPEIAFSFPRAESVCLAEEDPTIQHPDLIWDEQGMGDLEYNAFYSDGMGPPVWHMNEAQFTRGGIVIVSSHNEMLKDNDVWTRTGDRVLDLHEVGQMFMRMARTSVAPYIRYVVIGDPANPPSGSYFVDDPNTPGCWDCETNEYNEEGECTSGCADCGDIPDNPEETEYEYVIRIWDVWLGGG